jgi:hypothetical protein
LDRTDCRGAAIKTEIDPGIKKQLAEVATEGEVGGSPSGSFSWSPSGKALCFDCFYKGATNIWKMTIDPESLRAIAIDRLTAGPGADAWVAISPDGRRQHKALHRLVVAREAVVRHQVLPDGLAVASSCQALFDQLAVLFADTCRWRGRRSWSSLRVG